MPLGFHGFSFDLFAFSRRHPAKTQPVEPQASKSADELRDDEHRKVSDAQSDEVSFWGLAAFPVL